MINLVLVRNSSDSYLLRVLFASIRRRTEQRRYEPDTKQIQTKYDESGFGLFIGYKIKMSRADLLLSIFIGFTLFNTIIQLNNEQNKVIKLIKRRHVIIIKFSLHSATFYEVFSNIAYFPEKNK